MFDACHTAWLMEPMALETVVRHVRRQTAVHGWPTPAELEGAREAAAQKLRKVSGKVAVMQVHGVIENRMSPWGYWCDSFSCEAGKRALDSLLANKDVAAIVLDVDSPGGTSQGVEELADAIFEARGVKPVHAVANAMACSAAYWLSSSAASLYCCPSGSVGSVGAYAIHVDFSAALEEEGVKVSVARAGKFKAEWLPYAPLTDDARDYMQELVDNVYARFVASVARNRGTDQADVRKAYGQGRAVDARPALAAKMVDGLLTLDEILLKLTGQASGAPTGRQTSAEVLRLRHALRKAR